MTEEQKIKCNSIIHAAALLCGGIGAGLAQLPCSDSLAIIPIQLTMVLSLGAVFGIRLNQSTSEATLSTATATMAGRGISQVLIGWIPVVGNIINAGTAISVTEIIGWSIASDFANRTAKNIRSGK